MVPLDPLFSFFFFFLLRIHIRIDNFREKLSAINFGLYASSQKNKYLDLILEKCDGKQKQFSL